jgi:hypothetical protein
VVILCFKYTAMARYSQEYPHILGLGEGVSMGQVKQESLKSKHFYRLYFDGLHEQLTLEIHDL